MNNKIRIFIDTCPYCMASLNTVFTAEDIDPSAGDFSVCIHCTKIVKWELTNSGLKLVKCTPLDLHTLEHTLPLTWAQLHFWIKLLIKIKHAAKEY